MKSNKELQSEILLLIETRDNLKSCGNCNFSRYSILGQNSIEFNCHKRANPDSGCAYCDEWSFDGLTQKDRKVEI